MKGILTTALASAALSACVLTGCESTWNASNDDMNRDLNNSRMASRDASNYDATMARNALAGNTALSPQDKMFVGEAASSGLFEVQSSKLALQKSQDDQLKRFAQSMIDDHGKANDQLKQLAQSKGLTLPSSMNHKHQNVYDRLSSANGPAFDALYAKEQIAAHREAITLFRDQSRQGGDADLKGFADKTLPTLQHHLDMVTNFSAAPAGTKTPGTHTPGTHTPGTEGSMKPDATRGTDATGHAEPGSSMRKDDANRVIAPDTK